MIREPSINPTAQRPLGKLGGKAPLAVFLVLALAIGAVGYAVFAHLEAELRQRKYDELGAVGDLKVSQIAGWLGERRGDAAATAGDPILAQEVRRWLEGGARQDEAARRIEARLRGLREAYGYDQVILLNREARPVLVAGGVAHQHADAASDPRAAEAMSAGQLLLSDLHLEAQTGGAPAKANLSLYAPLIDGERGVVGAVYFQIDPYRFLFPFIQSWPTTSKSAETLLVRRDGDNVLFLNELRHREDSALRLRLPLNAPDMVAANALRGETGIIEGVDYRDVPVLAALRHLPGTAWHLVAKIDRAEVFAPMRNLAIGVGAIVAVLVAGAGLFVALWWRKQRAQVLVMHYEAEFERAALSKHLDLMSRHANDAIFLYDEAGRILEANERAVERYGYPRDELIGMSAKQLRTPDAAPEGRAGATRADETGSQIYETLHRRKDGSEFPVEASVRTIEVDGAQLMQGIIRDITARRQTERELRKLSVAIRQSGLGVAITDPAGVIGFVNPRFETMTGFSASEVVGKNPGVLKSGLTPPETYRDLWGTINAGKEWRGEIQNRRKSGELYWEMQHISPVFDDNGGIVNFIAIKEDVTEQRRAQHELQQFRMAMDVSADSIYLTDLASMRFVYLNDTACRRLGYTREQLLQKGPQDLIRMDPEQAHREFSEVVAAGDRGKSQEHRFVASDGSEGWTELRRRALRIGGGTLIVSIGRDITERKKAEARIARLSSLKDALSGVNHAIVHAESEQPLFEEICSILVERAGFDHAGIGIADPQSGEIGWVASAGTGAAALAAARRTVRADQPEGRGLTGTAVRECRHMISQDFLADPLTAPWHELGRTLGIGSTGAFPILRAGGAVGVINVYSKTLNSFDDEVVALLDEAAQDVSFALDNLDRKAQRQLADERIRRLNRIYAVLSGINSAIVRATDRTELLQEACRIAVEHGGFGIAQVHLVDEDACEFWPGPSAGIDKLPHVRANFRPGAETISLRGTTIRAIRERKPVFTNDITAEPTVSVLRAEALRLGYGSMISLPLVVRERIVAMLLLCAREKNFFDAEELRLLEELAGDISFSLDTIEKKEKLDYLAFYDPLTGLANRALFLERVNQSIRAIGPSGGKFALAILDLERLATINESLGRQAGDALIKLVAQRLQASFGPADAGRISGDYFAMILGEVKGRSQASRIVGDALRRCFGESFDVSGTELRLAAKAGVAQFPGDGSDAETLLRNAEAALRHAKDLGERQVLYTPALTVRTAGQLTLENQLREALEKDEFVLHYQPKVELETRRIVGVEALIRWQSPGLGLVPPIKFIPLMEETGLILEAGAWALKQAALDHRKWFELGLKTSRVAVNVSAIQLRQRDFVASVEQAITGGVAATGIDLEITESLIMEDVQGSIEKLKAVRGLGLQIAIDDFGTGYSSLGYLAKLPVQTLKIDRSFIITMLTDPDTMTLVSTIISLAHSLRLTVVAEGVEEEEQAKMLRLLRCDQMQGYLISRPVPFDQMTDLLTQARKT